MGSFIIKNKYEEAEIHYDEDGFIFKVEHFGTLLNREVNLDLSDFARENPVLYHQWCVRAAEELNADQENAEPNPAA